jgi:hypothetical protein
MGAWTEVELDMLGWEEVELEILG